MSHRCINAFEFAGQIYPGGTQIADDHPILQTHSTFFAKVQDNTIVGAEAATLAPNEVRTPQLPDDTAAEKQRADDTAAWLAAERQYEEDVQAWLLAEEEHQTAAALAAVTETAAQNDAAAETEDSPAARRAAARRQRGQEGKN